MSDGQIVIEVKIEDGTFRKAYAQLQDDSKEGGQRAGDNFSNSFSEGIKKVGIELAALATAYLGIRAVFNDFTEGVKSAMATDDAFRALNLTLAENGHYSAEAAAQNREWVHGLQESTGVQEQTIASGQQLLAGLGKLSGEGLQNATKAALNLAAAVHIGPDAAFRMLAEASQGHIMMFQRLGMNFVQTGDKGKDFATVLDKIKSMGNLAEGQMATFSGAITRLHNSWDDFWKAIGESVTHSEILRSVINSLSSMFTRLTESFVSLGKSGNVIDQLILKTLSFADTWSNYVLPPINLAGNVLKVLFEGMMLGLQQAIADLAWFAQHVIDFAAKFIPALQSVKDQVDTFAQSSADVVKDQEQKVTQAWDNLGNYDWTAKAQTNLRTWKQMAQEIVDTHKAATKEVIHNNEEISKPSQWDLFKAEWFKAAGTVDEAVKKMARSIQTGLVNGVANGFAAVGKSLVTGENLFAAFGKAVLSSFGQVLIQLGTQTLAVGLLMQGAPILFGLQGAAAVAAGIGMIIAGGALTAIASGGGGAAGSAGATGGAGTPTGLGPGGGVAVSPVGNSLTSNSQTQQNPGININIQGHVLDRSSTGLAIAEILRDQFNLNGVTFTGAANA